MLRTTTRNSVGTLLAARRRVLQSASSPSTPISAARNFFSNNKILAASSPTTNVKPIPPIHPENPPNDATDLDSAPASLSSPSSSTSTSTSNSTPPSHPPSTTTSTQDTTSATPNLKDLAAWEANKKINSTSNTIDQATDSIQSKAQHATDQAAQSLDSATRQAQSTVEQVKHKVESLASDATSSVRETAQSLNDTTKGAADSIPSSNQVDRAAQNAKDQVTDAASDASRSVQQSVQSVNDATKDAATSIPSSRQVDSATEQAKQKVQATAAGASQAAKNAVNDANEATKSAASSIPSSNEVDTATEQAKQTAADAASEAQRTISDTASEASRKADQLAKQANDATKTSLPGVPSSNQVADAANEAKETVAGAANKTAETAGSAVRSIGNFLYSTILLLGTGAFLVYAYDSRAGIHKWVILPSVMALTKNDPEQAHEWAVRFIASGLAPVDCGEDDASLLSTEVWGQTFDSPVGMAAGWDKHAEAIDGLFNLGFSYVEIGSVTPEPQSGNPKPRLFRIPEIQAVVNRYGFNSQGHDQVLERLRLRVRKWLGNAKSSLPEELLPQAPSAHEVNGPDYDLVKEVLSAEGTKDALLADRMGLPRSLNPGRVLGINLGKNKTSDPDSIDDFVKGVTTLGPFADVLIINVSSPNTPGLRDLQRKGMMTELLQGVIKARDGLTAEKKPPVLVKIAPDVDSQQLKDIAEAVQDSKVDGIIVSNTTISRTVSPEGLSTASQMVLQETGGLSGPPAKAMSLKALSELYKLTDGKIPLVGCGGISSGQDAVDFAKAGASLVQAYTSFIYHGVGLPRKLKDEIMDVLRKEGKSWKEIVGTGRKPAQKIEAFKAENPSDLDGGEQGTKRALGEREFNESLKEAKADLDALLKEMASFSSASNASALTSATKSTTKSTDAEKLAVPDAPSSKPRASESASTPTPSTTATPEATSSDSGKASSSIAEKLFKRRQPGIDDSVLAVPSQALLDENAIKVLLDPTATPSSNKTKTKGGQKEGQEVKEEKSVKGEGARWV